MESNIQTLNETDWIPLMDYATKYGVSLSTLRRHIKASKIQYRVENGRYLLQSPFNASAHAGVTHHAMVARPVSTPAAPQGSDADELRLRLRRAQEEITELKMLVAIYEEQLSGLKESLRPR